MEPRIEHEAEKGRFVAPLDDGQAVLTYARAGDDRLNYYRTWVPPSHRNRGIGEALVLTAMEHARSEGKKVIPTCPFVSAVVERHPEYQDLLADHGSDSAG